MRANELVVQPRSIQSGAVTIQGRGGDFVVVVVVVVVFSVEDNCCDVVVVR